MLLALPQVVCSNLPAVTDWVDISLGTFIGTIAAVIVTFVFARTFWGR